MSRTGQAAVDPCARMPVGRILEQLDKWRSCFWPLLGIDPGMISICLGCDTCAHTCTVPSFWASTFAEDHPPQMKKRHLPQSSQMEATANQAQKQRRLVSPTASEVCASVCPFEGSLGLCLITARALCVSWHCTCVRDFFDFASNLFAPPPPPRRRGSGKLQGGPGCFW